MTGAFKTQASPRSKSLRLLGETLLPTLTLLCLLPAVSPRSLRADEPLQLWQRLSSNGRLDEAEVFRLDVPSRLIHGAIGDFKTGPTR